MEHSHNEEHDVVFLGMDKTNLQHGIFCPQLLNYLGMSLFL